MPKTAPPAAPDTSTPTVQTLAIPMIRALDAIQPRTYLNPHVIDEYATLYAEAEGTEPLPPIDVFAIGKTYYVSDGFHRLEAAKAAKRTELVCRVYQGSQQDAMRHGAVANLRRGMVYSQQDRQRVLERFLADPEMTQRSNRDLGQLLGLSHVTVGRARQRLAALADLHKEWHAVPVTQPQEHIATFLQVEPAVVASYQRIIPEPLSAERLLDRIARRMTDSNETEADAKATVRRQIESAVQQRERERELRRQYRTPRPPKKTPEEQAKEEAEATRRSRERELVSALEGFVELLAERPAAPWRGAAYTLADMVQALSPARRQEIPGLLVQAETVIQSLRNLLA
jgi:hypothetical protein